MSRLELTIKRFEARIEAGQFYEAHQTLRTIINRYVKAKQYDEATKILAHGAQLLAEKQQYPLSADLISYLIDVYSEEHRCDNKLKQMVIDLVQQLPPTEPLLVDLSKQAILWSQAEENLKYGDSKLHDVFGAKLAKALTEASQLNADDDAKLFAVTELHLILGSHESVSVYIDLLYRWGQFTSNHDPGLFLSRAIINYGYLKNINFVTESSLKFINKFREDYANGVDVSYENIIIYECDTFPLINFAQLLAVTLRKSEDASTKFLGLYNHYKLSLHESDLLAPVEYLAKEYFGLQLGAPKQGNMMANLLGDFFK